MPAPAAVPVVAAVPQLIAEGEEEGAAVPAPAAVRVVAEVPQPIVLPATGAVTAPMAGIKAKVRRAIPAVFAMTGILVAVTMTVSRIGWSV